MKVLSNLLLFPAAALIAGLAWYWHGVPASAGTGTDASTSAAPRDAAANAPGPGRRLGTLRFQPCTLTAQRGLSLPARCTTLQVAENPKLPDGRKIALNIAWLPAEDELGAAPDPVFFLAGGPGQSATDSYPVVDAAFAAVRVHRHVILVDQRGTGQSNPLHCDFSDISKMEDSTAAVTATRACLQQLSSRADVRHYTTTDAVRDLDVVRTAIGAERINLVGVSYGTRVAQQYAMRHPGNTRSLVLDSVIPNTTTMGTDWARNLDDALALQFGRCGQDPACKQAFGDPRQALDQLLAKLRDNPPTVEYRDASSGELKTGTLHAESLAGLVRMFAYLPPAGSMLPLLIRDAQQGRYAGLLALSEMVFNQLSDDMAMGMQFSAICSEDGDRIQPSAANQGTMLGNTFTDFLIAQCKVWPKGQVPADFHQPLRGPVPTLVLEGEFDPVTPPRYGKEVVASLDNARMLVLRGQGHNVIGIGCMPRLFDQFIDTLQPKALDSSCLDTLPYVPAFTNFNGWGP